MKEGEPTKEPGKVQKMWAEEIAAKYNIELDKGAQHFVIPIYNKDGEELKREFLPTWEKIPFIDKAGQQKSVIPVEDAIEAVKKYPDLPFSEAINKLKLDQKSGA